MGRVARGGVLSALIGLFVPVAVHAADWLPISPEELAMKDEPAAPSAPAIYLYRQIDRDDSRYLERVYVRIKVLTDAGRSAGNVAIRFDRSEAIKDIEARTIRPDGSIVPFDGTVYDKPVMEGRNVRVMTKTFSLSDVQPGCIVEYRYERRLSTHYIFSSQWIVNADLYTKVAKFSLVPFRGYTLRATTPAGLPRDTVGPAYEQGMYTMVTRDVPPFEREEYMPPEDTLKMRVDFAYLTDRIIDKDTATFWTRWGKAANTNIRRYMDRDRAMKDAVAQIVSAADSPEQKLRKIYARVAQVRNLYYERPRSAQETERENPKQNETVADVWKNGYGESNQILLLFVALARAAGFQADPVALSTRDRFLLNEELRNPSQLNGQIAIVQLDGREIDLAPSVPFAPFGTLPWWETGVRGIRLDDSGGRWVTIAVPPASASRLERKATLRLGPDGSLEGTVTVTYSGLGALSRRMDERNEDDPERRRRMEDEVKSELASGGEVTMTSAPDWANAEAPLVAVFDVKVPGWGRRIGTRVLVPVGILDGVNRHLFEHPTRKHAVYFHFLEQVADDVTIQLPTAWKVTSVPPSGGTGIKIAACHWTAAGTADTLTIKREFSIDTLLVPANNYDLLQDFYQTMRKSSDEEAVLSVAGESRAQATAGT